MDEDNWMTVGKPKKVKSGEIKTENVPDEEELKLIMSMKHANVNKKEAPKKTQIPVKVKNATEPKAVPKPKKKSESPPGIRFKSLPAALNSLDLVELENLLETTKLQFNNDVIQLKTALTFLNEKLRLEKPEDSLFFDKPLDYPTNILSKELKSVLQRLVKNCSNERLQYFFHNLLQSLCEELNKSSSFVGHLILLQQIAHHYPDVCISNLASTVILRNSYQNQPSICLSLFWALGCSGYRNTTYGLKVWHEIVSTVINVRSYTKYVLEYLTKILEESHRTPDLEISLSEYRAIVDLLMSSDKIKSKDLQKMKVSCLRMLSDKFIRSLDSNQVEPVFLSILTYCKQDPAMFVREVTECIKVHPEECLAIWWLHFHSYSRQNIFIFNYLDNNINQYETLIDNKKFLVFIKQIDYGQYPNLLFVKDIPTKMTETKKQKKQKKSSDSCGSGCCRWVFGSFLLFAAIAGLITYDTNVLHDGKFEESSVGRVLKQTGALPHVENAWFVSLKYSARGYKWVEEQAPVAYSKSRTFMQPYCEFAKDLGLTILNGAKKGWESTKVYVAEKTPVVIAFVDNYVPGVAQKTHDFIVNACKGFCSLTCNGWRQSMEFFKTKVFVGQLSPENLGKALNSTTQRALGYYSWFHEKVDVYAKLK